MCFDVGLVATEARRALCRLGGAQANSAGAGRGNGAVPMHASTLSRKLPGFISGPTLRIDDWPSLQSGHAACPALQLASHQCHRCHQWAPLFASVTPPTLGPVPNNRPRRLSVLQLFIPTDNVTLFALLNQTISRTPQPLIILLSESTYQHQQVFHSNLSRLSRSPSPHHRRPSETSAPCLAKRRSF